MAGAAPGTTFGVDFMPNPLNLPNFPKGAKTAFGAAISVLFYWPETAGCSLQTIQTLSTLRNLPNQLLGLPNYGLWQAESFFVYWSETAGWSLQTFQTLQTFRILPNCLLELPNYGLASQVFSLLVRNCRMRASNHPNPSNLSNAWKTAKLALGAAKRSKAASQTVPWSCQTMRWQAKSFLYWPETARCALQTQTLQTLQTLGELPNWLLELPNVRLWQPKALLSIDPKVPDGPFKRSKRSKCVDIAKLFLGAVKL